MTTGPSEVEFLSQVLQLAKLCGWRTFHARPGRTARGGWRTAVQGDGAGFPDVLACRGSDLIFAELKVGNNRLSPAQTAWLAALEAAGVPVFLWRPSDWPTIEQTLRDGP